MRRISSSFANSSCMLARLGRPGLPRSAKSVAGALPGTLPPPTDRLHPRQSPATPPDFRGSPATTARRYRRGIVPHGRAVRCERCALHGRPSAVRSPVHGIEPPVARSADRSADPLLQQRDREAKQSASAHRLRWPRGIRIERSNLRAKAFRRSFSEEQSAIGRDGYLDLSRQGGDIQSLQIGWPAWEPTVIAEKHQPRCKRESVRSALSHHRGVIAERQRL